MSVMNKPDYKIFAQDAKSGEYVAFPDILRGWGITLEQYNGFPPMELFNSAAKRIDEWLMYLTQRGLPEWDAAVDYPKDAMIQHAGVYYVSLKVTKGEQPNNSQASWKKLTEALGVDKKLDKTAVLQGPGTSTTGVMSQKAVTDLANTKADGVRFSTKTSSVLMSSPNSKYGVEISNSGIFAVADLSGEAPVPIFRVLSTGEINDGSIALARVTGVGSAASKNTGTNPGQIPDMSSFGFANGAYTFPNGLILQVFSVTPSATNTVTPITFPVPFPNNPHGVWSTHNSSPSGQYMTLDALTKTGANMRVFRSDSTSPVTGAGTVTIMALGR